MGWFLSPVSSFPTPTTPPVPIFGTEGEGAYVAGFRLDDHGVGYSLADSSRDAPEPGVNYFLPYKLDTTDPFPIIDRTAKIYVPSGSYLINASGNQHFCVLSDTQIVVPMADNPTPYSGHNFGHGVITRSGDTISMTGVQQTFAMFNVGGSGTLSYPFTARVDDTHFMRMAGDQLQLCSVDGAGTISIDWTSPHSNFCQLLGMSSDGKMLGYDGGHWLAIDFDGSGFISEYAQGPGVASPDWASYTQGIVGAFRDTGDEGFFSATFGPQAVVWTGSAFAFSAVFTLGFSFFMAGMVDEGLMAQGAGPSGDWCFIQNAEVDGISTERYTTITTVSQSGTSLAIAAGPIFLFPSGFLNNVAIHSGRRMAAAFAHDPGLAVATSPTFGVVIASWTAP